MLFVAPSNASSDSSVWSSTDSESAEGEGLFASLFSQLGVEEDAPEEQLEALANVLVSDEQSEHYSVDQLKAEIADWFQQQGKPLPPLSDEHSDSQQLLGLLSQFVETKLPHSEDQLPANELAKQQTSIGGVALEQLAETATETKRHPLNLEQLFVQLHQQGLSAEQVESIDEDGRDGFLDSDIIIDASTNHNDGPFSHTSAADLLQLLQQQKEQPKEQQQISDRANPNLGIEGSELRQQAGGSTELGQLSVNPLLNLSEEQIPAESTEVELEAQTEDSELQAMLSKKADTAAVVPSAEATISVETESDAELTKQQGLPPELRQFIWDNPFAGRSSMANELEQRLSASSKTANPLDAARVAPSGGHSALNPLNTTNSELTMQGAIPAVDEVAEADVADGKFVDEQVISVKPQSEKVSELLNKEMKPTDRAGGEISQIGQTKEINPQLALQPAVSAPIEASQKTAASPDVLQALQQHQVNSVNNDRRQQVSGKASSLPEWSGQYGQTDGDSSGEPQLELNETEQSVLARRTPATATLGQSFDTQLTPQPLQSQLTTAPTASQSQLATPSSEPLSHAQQLAQVQEKMQLLQDKLAPMLGQRLLMMMDKQMQQAEIQLDPPELGSLMVRVQVQNDQAQVSFMAQSAQARDAIEQALPRLREMMQQQQIELTQANVSHQRQQGGQSGQGGQDQQSGQRHQQDSNGVDGQIVAESKEIQHVILKAGMVDFYA
ncbi:flagellar hook-length control protein FliK [Neiella sp. HB171785]|uniref:Flagellar hook-length control protein FliK n=1 Tax=Neiella litorisoli TaxID=2771431 RepID=A0A8J6QJ45_9GAMM|nr:flagellar hook-length control protein FliK [Neiella litorisoli]MBD1389858.1 flagellar hook-length control protein FliK [Neiella litorisoli]